jgi:hypothetical protein
MVRMRGSRNLRVADTTDGARYDESFEKAFAIIDSCFISALISGASVDCIKSALSYGFIQVLTERRKLSRHVQKKWLSQPEFVWQPIFEALVDDIELFRDAFDLDEVELEIEFLRNECKIAPGSLSEFEERRHSKIAHLLLQQCLETLSRSLIDARAVELAFLIEWLKISSICGEFSLDYYAAARSNPSEVEVCYARVVDQLSSS